MDELMVVNPDVGGVARARRRGSTTAIVDKRREAGEVAEMTVIGDAGQTCLIVDDISTRRHLCKAAEVLTEAGARRSTLHHPRRHVRPGGRTCGQFGHEIAGHHRQHRADPRG